MSESGKIIKEGLIRFTSRCKEGLYVKKRFYVEEEVTLSLRYISESS